jgi:hypothetical protein
VPVEHFAPTAHLAGQLPPQSVSVSVPFFTVSLQVGAWQVQGGDGHTLFGPQTPLIQSLPVLQFLPSAQVAPQQPPQLQSVSQASFGHAGLVTQLATATQTPAGQLPLAQSVSAAHFSPSAHFLPCATQVVPPQSTSVSEPFFTPSPQVAA